MLNIFLLNTQDLKLLNVYKKILEKDDKFPKFFWAQEDEYGTVSHKCRLLSRYCIENINKVNVEKLGDYDLKEIYAMLKDKKLLGMVMRVFRHDIFALLKNAYPSEFQNGILKEWSWSKHGIWQDKDLIIKAVKHMVDAEGIKDISKIPRLDWKQRLLNHGIYNILSSFDWSIYKLFNFVYPGRFRPVDFKYKCKWKSDTNLDNASFLMSELFLAKKYTVDDIVLLSTTDFRRLRLAGMLISLFNSSIMLAKEFYLFRTTGNAENQQKIRKMAESAMKRHKEEVIWKQLSKMASGCDIYNLRDNYTLYKNIKQMAKAEQLTISQYVQKLGFNYRKTRSDIAKFLGSEELLQHRLKGLTYVQIANIYDSNPTTISNLYKKYFGHDPLVPSPPEKYITVQELMENYRIDHKTLMKLVEENGLENHRTITNRYVKIEEIIPCIKRYIDTNKNHLHMVRRYSAAEA